MFRRLVPWFVVVTTATSAHSAPPSLEEARQLIADGHYAAAELAARAALGEAEANHGANSVDVAVVLDALVESLWRGGKATQPETREQAERAVRIKEDQLGPEHPDVAVSLNNLGWALGESGNPAEARKVHERALKIHEQSLGPEHPQVAISLLGLSCAGGAGGRELLDRALAILEKALGPEHPDVAIALIFLGITSRGTGDVAGARSAFERADGIFERTLGPEHPWAARSQNALACLLMDIGEYEESRRLYERALATWEKALGPEHPYVAMVLNNLGSCHDYLGDYDRSRACLEKALAIAEKARGPEHPDVVLCLKNLASPLTLGGDYAEAQRVLERAIAIAQKTGEDGTLLNTLGWVLSQMGDYDEAIRLHERALPILEREHGNVAECLEDIGTLLTKNGNYPDALRSFERALAIRETGPAGSEHASGAGNLRLQGELRLAMGDDAAARPLFNRALAIRERVLGPKHPELAPILEGLGTLRARSADYPEARAMYERALAILRAGSDEHPEVGRLLSMLSRVQVAEGDTLKALESSLAAEAIGRGHLRLMTRGLSETQALRYALVRSGGLDLALAMAAGGGLGSEEVRRVWDAEVRSRAVVLDEIAARNSWVIRSDDPVVDSLLTQLRGTRTRLANLRVRGSGELEPHNYRQLLEHVTRERDDAERALAARSAAFGAELARGRIGLEDVLESLPSEAALVAYCRYERPPPAGGPAKSPEAASYMAFIAGSGSKEVRTVLLGEAREIEAAVASWRAEVGRLAARSEARGVELAYRRAGEMLRARIWDPVAAHLANVERVFVVPDGALHLVNFGALPWGSEDYLVERGRLLHRLSAERDLVPGEAVVMGRGLLAVGDPDYARRSGQLPTLASEFLYRGPRSGCGEFMRAQFERLPGTRREAREVGRTWRRARKDEEVVLLDGARAEEGRVKAAMPGKRVVHLATHGFFLGEGCASALDGRRGIGVIEAPASEPPPVQGENPLLLTGLALAGANRRDKAGPDEEDGILTAEELGALDLRGVEWAVLSACDTGAGVLRAGEGVLGLGRALQVAGARTLVMSLLPVEDEAARAWMRALYEARLGRGLDTTESVREASLAVLRARRASGASTHPSTWGAFIATGDWR